MAHFIFWIGCLPYFVDGVLAQTEELVPKIRAIEQLQSQGRFQEAVRKAEELVRRSPEEVQAWLALAGLHLHADWTRRSDARAEQAAEKAHRLAPSRMDVLLTLATSRFRQDRSEDFEALALQIFQLHSEGLSKKAKSDLLTMRASLSLRRNSADPQRREQALRDLQIAVQLDPRNVSARLQRAQVRSESAEYEAAVQDLRVALQVAPGNKQVHFQLRVVLTRLQRRDQARHHLEVWKLLHRLTESVANASAPDLAERTEILLRLKELNPHDWGRRIELVQLLLHRELFAQAEGEIDTLREQGAPERTVQGLLEQSQQAQQRAREESDEDPQR